MTHQPYLKNPDEFPDPDQITPWGDQTIIIDFVGGPYRFSGLSDIQAKAIRSHFSDCVVSSCNSGAEIIDSRIAHINEDVFSYIDFSIPYLYDVMDYKYTDDSVRVSGIKFTAKLNLSGKLSATMWTPLDEHPWFSVIVFENFFRNLVAYRLLELGGVLLHSAGVVNNEDKAWLFVGHSGAGKSTIASFCSESGYSILSDDLNAILPHNETVFVEKVPFAGTFRSGYSRGNRYPISRLCRIVKDDKNHLEPISSASMLSLLIANSPFINQDPLRSNRLIENLLYLLDQCPGNTLRFSLGSKFIALFQTT